MSAHNNGFNSGIDAVVTNEGDLVLLFAGELNQLYTNDGDGEFNPAVLPPGVPAGLTFNPDTREFTLAAGFPTTTAAVALGDVDGDGDLDAFFANHGGIDPLDPTNFLGESNVLLINNGDGTFTATALDAPGEERNSDAVALGDLDGDGDLDALVGNDGEGASEPMQVYTNDGSGNFSAADVPGTGILGPASGTFLRALEVTLGDLDSDGDLDALVANDGDPNQVLINDGLGNFTAAFIQDYDANTIDEFVDAPDTEGVALADFDGDGDLDGMFANDGQGVMVSINEGDTDIVPDGIPNFTHSIVDGTGGDPDTGTDGMSSKAIAIADFDGDGDLDAVVANTSRAHAVDEFNQLLINDGNGNFTAVDVGIPRRTEEIVAADLDGDGDIDVLIGNTSLLDATHREQSGAGRHPNQILRNDGFDEEGNVIFTPLDVTSIDLARVTHGLALGDMDGDGPVPAVGVDGLPNINLLGGPPILAPTEHDLYRFTDAYSEDEGPFGITLKDRDGGIDTINAAAVTTGCVINLNVGATSTIDGTPLKIAKGTIENAFGGDGDDTIIGNKAANTLVGNEGDDTLYGHSGSDRLFGFDGNDHLLGGNGKDLLEGGEGDDILEGEDGDDVLLGGDGNDHLEGDGGDDVVFGDAGDDHIEGGEGDDHLDGGEDNDALFGGTGDDLLIGGVGDDHLNGGKGADTFVFAAGSGADVIEKFRSDDLIDLSAFGFADISDFTITKLGGDTVIDLGTGDTITFLNVRPHVLDADAFIL